MQFVYIVEVLKSLARRSNHKETALKIERFQTWGFNIKGYKLYINPIDIVSIGDQIILR